ncbi:MAG: molybdenum cofactor biosynthesis protein MoaE [Candidatus Sericytochromatia bacterium]|nr:molybdenum cofactor biosynthesis protein MoaE [Candidatus Sericytochromatia bacterium]
MKNETAKQDIETPCWYYLSQEPIAMETVHHHLADPAAGGEVVFTGTVRNHHAGRHVTALEFEAYGEMALAEFGRIAAAIQARWSVRKVLLWHRLGRAKIGETCVVVGVSAAHRAEAFEAARYGIDRLKAEAPIWKREYFEGGDAWVTNHP